MSGKLEKDSRGLTLIPPHFPLKWMIGFNSGINLKVTSSCWCINSPGQQLGMQHQRLQGGS